MDALERMNNALDYIENNLADSLDYADIARAALCSAYHFQRMFVFLAGIPLSEYIRRRRLTAAALALQNTSRTVADIALCFGYSSADTFARAFRAQHGLPPSAARQHGASLRVYPRLTLSLTLQGAGALQYRVEQRPAFQIVGLRERFSYLDNLGQKVGGMWAGLGADTAARLAALADTPPGGLVGAYSEMYPDSTTDYTIGAITTGPCPQNMVALQVPGATWAVFAITGPLPGAMAETWGLIFSEWFPTTGYEHAPGPEVEWYAPGDMAEPGYQSEIWIPIIPPPRKA